MAIDPRIALGFQQPEQPSQLNMLANALQVKGLMRQNQLGEMQLEQGKAAAAEQQALRNYLSGGASLDTPEGEAGLYRVAPTQAGGILKGRLELAEKRGGIAKDAATTKKTEQDAAAKAFELRRDKITFNLQALAGVQTPEQAAQWIQGGLQSGLIDMQQASQELQNIPRDPQGFAQWKQSQQAAGMTIAQQMEQMWKAKDFGLDQEKAAETKRSNKASEAISWTNAQTSKDRLAFDKAQPKGLLDQERGLLVDPRTGESRPVTMGGNPVGMKPDAATKKELMSLNQQESIIDGAIAAVKKTPDAFSFKRGLATMAGPLSESAVGRLDSDDEQTARSYIFNNVSRVINERAGAAQSAQELARLRSFLPAETDDARQVENKLNAFKDYLKDMRSGTTPNARPGSTGGWDADKERRYQEWKRGQQQ